MLVALSLPLFLPEDLSVVEASESDESPVDLAAPDEAAALLSEPVVAAALLSDEFSLFDDWAVDFAVDSAVLAAAVEEAAAVDSAAEIRVRWRWCSWSMKDIPELSCRGKTKSSMSRMAFRWNDSDHGADAALRAEKRAIEDRICAGRMLYDYVCRQHNLDCE